MVPFSRRLFVLLFISLLLLAQLSPIVSPVSIGGKHSTVSSIGNSLFPVAMAQSVSNDTTDSLPYLLNQSIVLVNDTDGDRLPDDYELNVTGTDPYTVDSDSLITAANESGNGINDTYEDFDHDALPNFIEYKLGADPFNLDSDGDGLIDGYEYLNTGTSPVKADSLEDGVNDGARDPDNDGLTNLQEQTLETNPSGSDTDMDGLSDGDEVNLYHTNPLKADTDNDGLSDSLEITIGSDPNNPDTNGNGIMDGQDVFAQHFVNDTLGVSIEITGSAFLQDTLVIREEKYPYASLLRLSGVTGNFIDVNTTSNYNTGTIRIGYNESALNGSSEYSLKLYYFDWESLQPVEAPDQVLDTTSDFIEAPLTYLGVWFIADNSEWVTVEEAVQKFEEQSMTRGRSASMFNGGDFQTLSMTPEYNVGDTINIYAQVHNTGNAAIDSSRTIDVAFYDGIPSSDTYINTVPLYGGIPAGGSRTAALGGYVITELPVDIYVKVDPNNNIQESNDFSNNQAYKVLSVGGTEDTDSDGDTLTDDEETNGMYDEKTHQYIYSDPYESDTDGDGVSDGVEMGGKHSYSGGATYYWVNSYPDNPDSDNDGLSDYEESLSHTIYLADSHDRAVSFMNAIAAGEDGTQYLHEVTVAPTDPMNPDWDGDGVKDGDELDMGTNPRDQDSDHDNIMDNREEVYGEDPTVFDVTGPQVKVTGLVTSVSLDLTYYYHVWYYAFDAGGLSSATVSKNGGSDQTFTFSPGATGQSTDATITTNTLQTILDELGVVNVKIASTDRNSNSNTITAYHRDSMFSQWGYWLSTHIPNGGTIAGCTGIITGAADCERESFEDQFALISNPSTYFTGLYDTANSLLQDQTVLQKIIDSMPQAIKEQQDQQNPYDEGTNDYTCFEHGYYVGYVGMQIISMFTPSPLKLITSSEDFLRIVNPILDKMGDFKTIIKDSNVATGIAGKVGMGIAEKSELGASKASNVVKDLHTASQEANAWKRFVELPEETRDLITGKEAKIGDLLGSTPGDVSGIISGLNSMEGTTVNKILSFTWSSKSDLTDFNGKLFEMKYIGASDNEISSYLDNILAVEGQTGANKFIENIEDVRNINAFKDIEYEAERAAYFKIAANNVVIEVKKTKGIDIKAIYSDHNLYAELKTAHEGLSSEKLKRYVGSAQDKIKDLSSEIRANDLTKLEINAREGLNGLTQAEIVTTINDYLDAGYLVNLHSEKSLIGTIDIFKPGDGSVASIILEKQQDGHFMVIKWT